MAIVIVTKNQYILASKIHHIAMNEHSEWNDVRNKKGRYISVKELWHNIHILYTPEAAQHAGSQLQCDVSIKGRVDAYKVYKSLIEQIREQCPDELFLNTALERLLSDKDFEVIQESLNNDNSLHGLVATNDRRSKKVRRARKAKRNSKAVLRKTKRRR